MSFKKFSSLCIIILMLLVTGCQNQNTPVDPFQNFNQSTLTKATIPYGAVIDSAKLYINVTSASDEEVTLHRITNFWKETTVTWNNFSAGFDPAVESFFSPSAAGWYAVELTGTINGWINETYPNYGILLKEDSPAAMQYYSSKESGDAPYLLIWWATKDSSGYDSTSAVADSYIHSDSGDVNFGTAQELITGWMNNAEVQSLIGFEIEIVYDGCTRSKGYWKTHSAYGPAPYNDTWALLGEDSTFFLSNQSNYEVMWTPPSGGNAYYMLAHQYIATQLNLLGGADPEEIQNAFDDATDLFETYTPQEIGSLQGNNPLRQEFIGLKSLLAQYNGGEIGPAHCGENNTEYPYRAF